jgi:hypothetical protein
VTYDETRAVVGSILSPANIVTPDLQQFQM